MSTIRVDKETVQGNVMRWSNIYHRMDSIINENAEGMFWTSFDPSKPLPQKYPQSYTIYDRKKKTAYTMHNEDWGWTGNLEAYALRQWRRFCERS